MVVKVKGEFVWHSHPDTDDFFFVLKGNLTIKLRDSYVRLDPATCMSSPRELSIAHSPKKKPTCCSLNRLARLTPGMQRPPL